MRLLDDPAGLLDLGQCRHQRRAIFKGPAVILHVGDFQPVGIEFERHLDDLGQLEQVLPVHDRVDGQRQIQLARPPRDLDFLLMRVLETCDSVGEPGFVALETDLHMGQSGVSKRGQAFAAQQHGGGDEIRVQPNRGGVPHQFHQILARGRLATREMNLQHAHLGQFRKDLLPFLRRQLAAAALQLDGVGAIGTLQRTSMRQFREHGEGNAESLGQRAALLQHRHSIGAGRNFRTGIGHGRTHYVFSRASVRNPLSARSCSIAITSAEIAPRSAA